MRVDQNLRPCGMSSNIATYELLAVQQPRQPDSEVADHGVLHSITSCLGVSIGDAQQRTTRSLER
jgi:hypothetical protein